MMYNLDMDIAKELGLDKAHHVGAFLEEYYGSKDWVWISFPMFCYSPILRMIKSSLKYECYAFNVANDIANGLSWWPLSSLKSLINVAISNNITLDEVFIGKRPPFTEWVLDKLIFDGASYEDICDYQKEHYFSEWRFSPTVFCGRDFQTSSFGRDTEFAIEMWKDLDPPLEIQQSRAEWDLKKVVEKLGVDKSIEIINSIKDAK